MAGDAHSSEIVSHEELIAALKGLRVAVESVLCRYSLLMVGTSMTLVAVSPVLEEPTVASVWTTVDVTWQRGLRKVAALCKYSTPMVIGCST